MDHDKIMKQERSIREVKEKAKRGTINCQKKGRKLYTEMKKRSRITAIKGRGKITEENNATNWRRKKEGEVTGGLKEEDDSF